jgi:hypothetical protein
MKIKCVSNSRNSLPNELLKKYSMGLDHFSVFPGNEYIVYSVGALYGFVWYCICDESYIFYPMWNPEMLFEIIDKRLSRYWVFSLDDGKDKKIPFLRFPEWANNPYFYEELIDGDSSDANAIIFSKYKELMDLEFPNPLISDTAEIGDRDWLICPKCIDAWKSESNLDALVRCPICTTVLNNPRYVDRQPHF